MEPHSHQEKHEGEADQGTKIDGEREVTPALNGSAGDVGKVGEGRKSTSGSLTSAMARTSRCFSPLELGPDQVVLPLEEAQGPKEPLAPRARRAARDAVKPGHEHQVRPARKIVVGVGHFGDDAR